MHAHVTCRYISMKLGWASVSGSSWRVAGEHQSEPPAVALQLQTRGVRGASLMPRTAHAYNNWIRGQCPVLPRGLRSGAGRVGWDGRLCRVSTRHADALDPDPPRPSRRCVKGGPARACRSFWRIARTRLRRVARAGHPRQLLAAEKSSSNEGVQYIAGLRVRTRPRRPPWGPDTYRTAHTHRPLLSVSLSRSPPTSLPSSCSPPLYPRLLSFPLVRCALSPPVTRVWPSVPALSPPPLPRWRRRTRRWRWPRRRRPRGWP